MKLKRFIVTMCLAGCLLNLVGCSSDNSNESEGKKTKVELQTGGNYYRQEINGKDYYVSGEGILTVDEVLEKCKIPDVTEYSGECLSTVIFNNTVIFDRGGIINRYMYTLDGKCIYSEEDKEDPNWLWTYEQEDVMGFNPSWRDLYIYTNDDYCKGIKNLKGDILLKADFYRSISIGCCTADDIILLCRIDEYNNPYDAECDSDEMYDIVSLKTGKAVMTNLYIEDTLHDIYIGVKETNNYKDYVVELTDSDDNSTWYKNGKISDEAFNYDEPFVSNVADSDKYGRVYDAFGDYVLYFDYEADTYTACYKGDVVGTYTDVELCRGKAAFGYYFVEYDNNEVKFYSFKTGEELEIPTE